MRVIAGSARHLPLKTVDGPETRPTTDRIKETLFNIIQNGIYGCRFLDLYSGSGAIGIEALSRGAKTAVFIEKNSEATVCIRENLKFTRLEDKAIVMKYPVDFALQKLEEGREAFEYIFMDPPYGKQEEKKVLEYLSQSILVNEDTVIIIEADLKTDFSYLAGLGFSIKKIKRYKTNQHLFIIKE